MNANGWFQTNLKTEDGRFMTLNLRELLGLAYKSRKVVLAFRNDDILDYREENLISVTKQREELKNLYVRRNKSRIKHETGYYGVTVQKKTGHYVMHFYLDGRRIDTQDSGNAERLALYHDLYSVLYSKEPLNLNFSMAEINEAKGKFIIKTLKWRKNQKMKLLLKDDGTFQKTDGRVVSVYWDDYYDIAVVTQSGEDKTLERVHAYDIRHTDFQKKSKKL
jgi:hypothetical protein